MTIKHYSILCLSLMMSFNTLSATTESTVNYAYGAELNLTDNESMFSRVELDRQAYTQTQSPTLADVRVFNRNGQTVPFTLIDVYDKQQNKQQFEMVLYAIDHDNVVGKSGANSDNYSLSIQGQNVNVSIDKPSNNRGKYTHTYLLQIPSDSKVTNPISHLKLTFAQQPENWQATADVSYSSDLMYWNNVVSNVPVMTLANNDNQTLTLTDISFQPYSYYTSNNWLITLYSQKSIPELTSVVASSNSASVSNALYPIDFSLVSSDEQNAIYTLPASIPIKELSIELFNARSVLPVSIFYKANHTDEKWLKLEDRILRKTDSYDDPSRIQVNERLIAELKLVTINSSFTDAPKLIAYRNKVDLVFNSANNGPFILAWGAAEPKAAALSASSLLSANDSVLSLPLAFIGNPVKLAGPKALEIDNNRQSSGFPSWIIWLGLIIGAGILVLLALRLLKEIKQQ